MSRTMTVTRRFSLQPVLDLMPKVAQSTEANECEGTPEYRLGTRLSFTFGTDPRHLRNSVYRWKRDGLTARTADRIATALNYHPCQLWPEWFEDVA